jgi:hypothetical protein
MDDVAPAHTLADLADRGYALIAPDAFRTTFGLAAADLDALTPTWSALPRDTHLRDGGRYRRRRHSCFIQSLEGAGALTQTPHRAHFQPTDYNALHGGIERWFEPIADEVVASRVWQSLLSGLGRHFATLQATPRWHIEAHQFRIDTSDGIGRPTPEGAHRDGVDFVAVILVNRVAVRGGETRVFELSQAAGLRFTIREPWTALLLDDARVVHETTPIQPEGAQGVRDTLVLTYRAAGFQSPG